MKKLLALALAMLALVMTCMSATYAWQGPAQTATNELYSAPVGFVRLQKLDKSTNQPLQGAEFLLFREGDEAAGKTDEQIGEIYTTGSTGYISNGQEGEAIVLPEGEYYFIEYRPAEGYGFEKDENGNPIVKHSFTITEGNTYNLEVYNVRQTADLTITKNIPGIEPDENSPRYFDFTISLDVGGGPYDYYIYDSNGDVTGSKQTLYSGDTISLRYGCHAVIKNLPVGAVYNVTETVDERYVLSSSGHSGTIDADGATAAFTNSMCSIVITKKVVNNDAGGEGPNPDMLYSFEVEADGKTKTTQPIKAGESITINGLPVGAEYTVTELEPEYPQELLKKYDENGNPMTDEHGNPVHNDPTGNQLAERYHALYKTYVGTINSAETIGLEFINVYDPDAEETGGLIINKRVTGELDPILDELEYVFRVSFEDDESHEYVIYDANGELVAADNDPYAGLLNQTEPTVQTPPESTEDIFLPETETEDESQILPDEQEQADVETPNDTDEPGDAAPANLSAAVSPAAQSEADTADKADMPETEEESSGGDESTKEDTADDGAQTPIEEQDTVIERPYTTVTDVSAMNNNTNLADNTSHVLSPGGTISLKKGEQAVFTDLPHGLKYTVEEVEDHGMSHDVSSVSGTVISQQKAEISVVNKAECKITVTKILNSIYPDEPLDGRDFAFSLYLNEKLHTNFTLSAGESKSFTIPFGSRYEVREENLYSSGYAQTIENGAGTADRSSIEVLARNTQVGRVITEIEGQKTWDFGSYDENYPEHITVKLKQGSYVVATQTVRPDENNEWHYSFTVDKYDAYGGEIEYTVEEDALESFEPVYSGYNIKNTYVAPVEADPPIVRKIVRGEGAPDMVFEFVVRAAHEDYPMPEGSSQGSKVIRLEGAGNIEFGTIRFTSPGVYEYTVSELGNTGDGWTYDSSNYTITFTVTKLDGELSAEYSITKNNSAVSQITFTNVYDRSIEGEKITIEGEKTWDHGDNPEKYWPGSIIVSVYADGAVNPVASRTVSADSEGRWLYSFELPRYASGGAEIVYTVKESPVECYKPTVTGYDIKNTFNKEYVVPTPPPGATEIPVATPKPSGRPGGSWWGPRTGDSSNIALWILFMLISAAAMVVTVMLILRKGKRKGKHGIVIGRQKKRKPPK